MKKQLVFITHNGLFHADEVCALALLELAYGCAFHIVRTRNQKIIDESISESELAFTVDVGGKHNPNINQFDHHQDIHLPASNMLVFQHLAENYLLVGNWKYDDKFEMVLRAISDWDTNKDNLKNDYEHSDFASLPNISNIISGFNRFDPEEPDNDEVQLRQFTLAVEAMKVFLQNELYLAEKRIESVEIYESAKRYNGGTVLFFDRFCSIWQDKGKEDGVIYAVFPSKDQWNVQTINSNEYPLPEEEVIRKFAGDNFVFAHKGRFVAGFKDAETALNFADSL